MRLPERAIRVPLCRQHFPQHIARFGVIGALLNGARQRSARFVHPPEIPTDDAECMPRLGILGVKGHQFP